MPDPNKKFFEDVSDSQRSTDQRLQNIETTEFNRLVMVHPSSIFMNPGALVNGVVFSPATSPASFLSVDSISGIIANFWLPAGTAATLVYFSSSDDTPDANSQRYYLNGTTAILSQLVFIPVGSDGNINLLSDRNVNAYMTIIGYWI